MKNEHKRNKTAISAHFRQGGGMGGTRRSQRRKGRKSARNSLDDVSSRYNHFGMDAMEWEDE